MSTIYYTFAQIREKTEKEKELMKTKFFDKVRYEFNGSIEETIEKGPNFIHLDFLCDANVKCTNRELVDYFVKFHGANPTVMVTINLWDTDNSFEKRCSIMIRDYL